MIISSARQIQIVEPELLVTDLKGATSKDAEPLRHAGYLAGETLIKKSPRDIPSLSPETDPPTVR